MKVKDFNLQQWQDCLIKFRAVNNDTSTPAAMRCENTQLSIARHFGGITYNGEHYTYFEPVIPGEPNNPDGSPYVAWLMVRDDFLRFATKEAKNIDVKARTNNDVVQSELFT